MVSSKVRPRMLTFLLRIYYAFIIKMLPFEVFRQKLSISFLKGAFNKYVDQILPNFDPHPLDILDTVHPMSRGLSYDHPGPAASSFSRSY